jgi:hypothetical protein
LGRNEGLIDHLHHMGILVLFFEGPVPAEYRFHAVLQIHEQGQAEPQIR